MNFKRVMVGLSLTWWAITATAHGASIQAGLAQVDITPPIGGRTTGYADADPTDGVHDPVTARVIVLKSGELTLALVSCDLCVFNSEWLHDQMPSLGIDELWLMNTHTHAGPDMNQMDFPDTGQPWRRTVEQRIIEAIQQAQGKLFDAYFLAAEGQLQLGYNRLVRQGKRSVTHFENPERIPYGKVDPSVGVIRISDEQGQVRGVIVVYTCHPVVLGPRNRKISADYPGVARNVIESRVGQDAMCFFVQGAAGDVNPLFLARGDERQGDFALVERMGQLLADEVLRVLALHGDRPGKSDELLSRSSQMEFNHRWNPQQTMTLGVSSLLINREVGVITLPGEPFHELQVDFRQRAELPSAFVFGYCCNGPYAWPSYLPDVLSAARGGYGASDTTQAEVGAGERLVNRGLAQLFELEGRLLPQPQRHLPDEISTVGR